MFTDVVIMAGGSGTRLWPASNSKTPKQFLPIPGGSSFFGAAVERAFAVLGEGDGQLLVIAGAAHLDHARRCCRALPVDQQRRIVLIGEPVARNTAPAMATAATFLKLTGGSGRRALVLTSDHIIGPIDTFCADARAASSLAAQGKLVVFGIPPRSPETGFGYIEVGGKLPTQVAGTTCHAVTAFHEKPNLETARRFLASGSFLWNSGMFAFDVEALLAEFQALAPGVLAPIAALAAPDRRSYQQDGELRILANWDGFEAALRTATAISFDYAVAEKSRKVALVAARFDWLDIGSWDDYARFMDGNSARAGLFEAGAKNCFVDADLPVALCGVENLIVVVRSGADGSPPSVLICKKGESQGIRAIVDDIKAKNRSDLL